MRTNAPNAKPNGYILHETEDIVVIATGFTRKSANPKTGDMIQVWILPRHINPVEAVKTGADAAVCLDCKLRGDGTGKGRLCYVRVPNAPLGVWKAYQRGNYPKLDLGTMADYDVLGGLCLGRKVRFGAYGEPVLIPVGILATMAHASDGWTGYTHQWNNPVYSHYRRYVMASVDTAQEFIAAKMAGWRTFRVRGEDMPLLAGEIMCPASEEAGKRTTCADCRLCSGALANDPRKDIAIVVHGAGKRKFELISIAGVN